MTERAKTPSAKKADPSAGRGAWQEKLCRPGFLCLVLALVTLAVFLPVAWQGFVNYDDSDYVTENTHVQGGLTWGNIVWAFTTGHASNWHPLTWLSHMLDYQLFGLNGGGHHLVSVGFHIANTLLLFLLLRRMTGALWRSVLVAALFALHPLHVESVAWASERKDVLSAFLFLLTLWAYVRYTEVESQEAEARNSGTKMRGLAPESQVLVKSDGSFPLTPALSLREREDGRQRPREAGAPGKAKRPATVPPLPKGEGQGEEEQTARLSDGAGLAMVSRPRRPRLWYFMALVLFALGLMSKPMLVTVPFVLLLLDYWPLMRLRSAECGVRNGGRQSYPLRASSPRPPAASVSSLLLEKVPFFLVAAASSVVTFVVQRKGGAVSTALTVGERIANALVSYVRYIGKMFWPRNLSILYPHPGHWPAWQMIASAVLLLAVCVAVVLLARKRPYLAVGWLWFCGTLVPVIGLVQVGIQSMADRYTYVPIIGLFIMLVWGLDALIPEQPWRGKAAAVGAGLAVAACALLTARQIRFWRDSEVLFGHAVQVTCNNYLAYNNLGFYLNGRGRTAEAMENYRMALKINPAYEDALNNLGYALAGQKKYTEAIPLYEAALRVRPNHAEVHNNLGNALSEVGHIDEAIQHYRVVLQQKPEHADAHNNLGIALAMKGKLDEAMPHFYDAIRYKPSYASAHSNLGNALAVQHKLDEAIKEYQIALGLKPEDAQAHNNLGNALAEQGKVEEAIAHYRAALRLNADNPEAHFNLALALLRQGKREDTAAHLKEALRLKPDYAEAQKQLNALTAQPGL